MPWDAWHRSGSPPPSLYRTCRFSTFGHARGKVNNSFPASPRLPLLATSRSSTAPDLHPELDEQRTLGCPFCNAAQFLISKTLIRIERMLILLITNRGAAYGTTEENA